MTPWPDLGAVVVRGCRVPAVLLPGHAAVGEFVRCDIAVQDGRIAAIAAELPPSPASVQADGIVVPGFVDLANHGVGEALLGPARDQMRDLFALPLADRLAIALDRSDCHHGYEPMQAQRLEAGAPPDLKEGFYIGNEIGGGPPARARRLLQPGPEPVAGRADRQFRPAMQAYFAAMEALSRRLMSAMALSLSLPADSLRRVLHRRDVGVAAAALSAAAGQPAARREGLRRAHRLGLPDAAVAGRGRRAAGAVGRATGSTRRRFAGTFVVNIGDMFARWTNDRYRSTLHRVVNRSGRDRYSVPFFFAGHGRGLRPGGGQAGGPGAIRRPRLQRAAVASATRPRVIRAGRAIDTTLPSYRELDRLYSRLI